MARKTAPILPIIVRVNTLIKQTETTTPAERLVAASILESVLMDNGVYAGFSYTDGANGSVDPSQRRYNLHYSLSNI